ncbi:thio(seleno)oxazole modification radical SAM maturase SbtM [Deferrisoma palaeochoriense]
MNGPKVRSWESVFPAVWSALSPLVWGRWVADLPERPSPGWDPEEALRRLQGLDGAPPHAPNLARLEWARYRAARVEPSAPVGEDLAPNPTLSLLRLGWRGLTDHLNGDGQPGPPEPGEEWVLVWRRGSGEVVSRPAGPEDLLALKLVAEGISPERAALEAGVPQGRIERALWRARDEDLVLGPAPLLGRDPEAFGIGPKGWEPYWTAHAFTLQWHLTQTCDLRCKHCYDRSPRRAPDLREAVRVLDELDRFCRERRVRGQVTFTGGNPLLHPRFPEIYREAADRGFDLAILGNPSGPNEIDVICAIRVPEVFQVSLEGLEPHNDEIRGPGHFRRTLAFLDVLRERGVFSMVMLTLTRDNVDQVLPLAEALQGRADRFHFNRLSPVGEGATLGVVEPERYRDFLREYRAAAADLPILGLKDNLFNRVLAEAGEPVFGGCTGFGCGAAFNFVSLLPDGEVHACRKFPSPIGNLTTQSLSEIYDSPLAARYRAGPAACRGCAVRPVCGGCLASASGAGRDPFGDRDPWCPGPVAAA